jgi:hypothetical protein
MCGICAKSFSSFEAAQKHEDYHIKEVVMDLGWLCNPATNFLSSMHDPSSLENHSSSNHRMGSALDSQHQRDVRSAFAPSAPTTLAQSELRIKIPVSPPRPDVLTMSTRNLTSTRAALLDSGRNICSDRYPDVSIRESTSLGVMRYDPINDLQESVENHLLVPHGIRDYIVLADEALIDVCSKAQNLILTELEKEAEFELACYSKDKEYYDMLERREVERQRDGAYSRFRTEGKNIAQKVQNKFVDAYALMKEGKTRRTLSSVDHYKRKLKGDTDVQNVITNTKDTLYVNVIVKNSLRVVNHELERLARQRWEEKNAKTFGKGGPKKDTRSEEGIAQFERFKAAAQGNLVKLAGFALASDFTPRRIAVQLSNDLYRYVTVFTEFVLGDSWI